MERLLIPLPLNFLGSPAGTSRTLSASGIIAPKVMQKTLPPAHPASSILLSRAVAYLLCNGRTWLSRFRHPPLLHSPPYLRPNAAPILAASPPTRFKTNGFPLSYSKWKSRRINVDQTRMLPPCKLFVPLTASKGRMRLGNANRASSFALRSTFTTFDFVEG